MKKYVT